MIWNPFTKNKKGDGDSEKDSQKMGMMEKIAMKKLAKMSPQERDKMVREFLDPKNKDKIEKVMKYMKASGKVTEEQIEEVRKKMGF